MFDGIDAFLVLAGIVSILISRDHDSVLNRLSGVAALATILLRH